MRLYPYFVGSAGGDGVAGGVIICAGPVGEGRVRCATVGVLIIVVIVPVALRVVVPGWGGMVVVWIFGVIVIGGRTRIIVIGGRCGWVGIIRISPAQTEAQTQSDPKAIIGPVAIIATIKAVAADITVTGIAAYISSATNISTAANIPSATAAYGVNADATPALGHTGCCGDEHDQYGD